jgi:hypothetical protein
VTTTVGGSAGGSVGAGVGSGVGSPVGVGATVTTAVWRGVGRIVRDADGEGEGLGSLETGSSSSPVQETSRASVITSAGSRRGDKNDFLQRYNAGLVLNGAPDTNFA